MKRKYEDEVRRDLQIKSTSSIYTRSGEGDFYPRILAVHCRIRSPLETIQPQRCDPVHLSALTSKGATERSLTTKVGSHLVANIMVKLRTSIGVGLNSKLRRFLDLIGRFSVEPSAEMQYK